MKLGSKLFKSFNPKSLILGIVIVCAVLAFVFTGFGRLQLSDLSGLSPNTAAQVGDVKIEMDEFAQVMNNQGLSNSMPEAQKKYMASMVLNRMIDQKILLNEALNYGWDASTHEVDSFIRTVPAFQNLETKQFSYELVKKYMDSNQLTEDKFFNLVREQIEVEKIQNILRFPAVYPDAVAKTQYMIDNTEFNLQYAIIDLPPEMIQSEKEKQISDYLKKPEQVKKLEDIYKSNPARFTTKSAATDSAKDPKSLAPVVATQKSFDDVKSELAWEEISRNSPTNGNLQLKFEQELQGTLVVSEVYKTNQLLNSKNITWKTLKKPFKISDTFVNELGSTTELAENIFNMKKSGDILTKVINFGAKKGIVKLMSFKVPQTVTKENIEATKKKLSQEQSQYLAQNFIKTLRDTYQKNGKIKTNPLILAQ